MLNLTELRRHLQEDPAFTLTTEVTLELIGIVEAGKEWWRESDKQSNQDRLKRRVYDTGDTIDRFVELLKDVEIGDA